MPNTIPEIAFLLKEVERKYGREVHTSTDFESLSVVIERDINEYISASTLKRMWGYVTLKPTPRVATLDSLSRFIGYTSFNALCEALKTLPDVGTGFFSTKTLLSAAIQPGTRLVIGWPPKSQITLRHEGGGKYLILNQINTDLRQGDQFYSAGFLLGCPLYLTGILRDGQWTSPFVAGKQSGLNCLEML